MRSKCKGDTEVLASIYNTNSGQADSDFKTVKKTKVSRKVKNDLEMVYSYNMFEVFNNPDLFPVTMDEVPEMQCKTEPKSMPFVTSNKSKRKARFSAEKMSACNELEDSSCEKKDQLKKGDEFRKISMKEINSYECKSIRAAPLTKLKITSHSLRKFEGNNQFSIFEDNAEEDFDKIVLERSKIINMKKTLLKKCKTCNFKKRSCMLDRSSCSAFSKVCFACKKDGHFPKSINCKKSRKSRKYQIPSIPCKNHPAKQVKISATNMSRIKDRIGQLESIYQEEEESILDQNEKSLEKKYKDLIPFTMMYIFLNYDCFTSISSSKERLNVLKQARKENNLKKIILETAKDCAKKFGNGTHQGEDQSFSVHCTKKVKKNHESYSNSNQWRDGFNTEKVECL